MSYDVIITIHKLQDIIWPYEETSHQGLIPIEAGVLFSQGTSESRSSKTGQPPKPIVEISVEDKTVTLPTRAPAYSHTIEKTIVLHDIKSAKTRTSLVDWGKKFFHLVDDEKTTDLLEIKIYHKTLWGQEFIGSHCKTLTAIHSSPNKSLIRSRVPLIDLRHPGVHRGWLFFSAFVLKEGQLSDIGLNPFKPMGTDEDSSSIDQFITSEQHQLEVRIFWGRDFPRNEFSRPPNLFAVVKHGGNSINLPTITNTTNPTWNCLVLLPVVGTNRK